MQDLDSSQVIRFDLFELDFQEGALRQEGQRIKLQEQPFRILSLLVQSPGKLVTRDDLRRLLWPADTFVDFDHGLNSAVARLREALGDSASKPRFIETVAKKGYRFIGIADSGESAKQISAATPPVPKKSGWRRNRWRRVLATGTAFSTLFFAVGLAAFHRKSTGTTLASIEVTPLAGLRGFQITPAVSRDGSMVAFRQSDGTHNTGIFTSLIGGEISLELTHNSGDCCPVWSPDGRQLAFERYSEGTFSIFTLAALGGTERRVYRGTSAAGNGISWSPDGKMLAFTESRASETPRCWISLLSLTDQSTTALTSPPAGSLDAEPAFSPDGTQLAFVRSTVAGVNNDLYVTYTKGGSATHLTFDHLPIMGPPTWTADGRELVFSSARGGRTSLWRVSATGGLPHPVAGPVGQATWPSIPARGNQLVYEQVVKKFNLWRLDLRDPRHTQRPPVALVSEKGDKMRPDWSPDGKKIAFESDRLGSWEIWTCTTDGSSCDQVTSLHGTAGRARWSPNGRYIAFEFHPNERSEIYLVEIPGGVPRLLPTIAGADNLSPSWSRDGQWIYFASKGGDEPFQIWKIPVQGGTPVKLTTNGGISPVESLDGRFLYYSKYESGGVWKRPLHGGEETRVLDEAGHHNWADWCLTSQGIYFLRFDKSPHVKVQFLDFATGKTVPIWTMAKEVGWGLGISHDGRSLVYVQNEFAESDIMLVKNFQ